MVMRMKKSKTTKKNVSRKIEDDVPVFQLPNLETIPCLTCKWGLHNFKAYYCVKYNQKPHDVYFESKPCKLYEPINKTK